MKYTVLLILLILGVVLISGCISQDTDDFGDIGQDSLPSDTDDEINDDLGLGDELENFDPYDDSDLDGSLNDIGFPDDDIDSDFGLGEL